MGFEIPTWWFLVAGFCGGVIVMLLVMTALSFWAYWPRARELALEKEVVNLELALKAAKEKEANGQ